MKAHVALVLLAWLTAGAAGGAQQGARDRAGAPSVPIPSGTGVIAGTIVGDDQAARPVRRATVTLAGSAAAAQLVAITDDEGRFTFGRLPSGSYTITADKPAYVRLIAGSKHPGRGPGVPIALADGQRLDVTLKMLHGSAITGTVLDASGRPAPEILIEAVALTGASRAASTLSAGTATTDDRGTFRIFGLAPGDYVVFALPRVAGFDTDLHPVTPDDVRWAQARASGALPVGAPVPQDAPAVGLTRVYFPGTTRSADAVPITLGAGDERTASFPLQLVPTARIDGTVVDPTGSPAQSAQISLVQQGADRAGDPRFDPAAQFAAYARTPVVNGKFALLAVAPGAYTVVVRGGPAVAGQAGPGRGMPVGRGGAAPTPWWGEADITVDGRDQSGLAITMQPGMTVAGKLVFDGAIPPPSPVTRVRVELWSADNAPPSLGSVAVVNEDGTFVASNLVPGHYNLRATLPAAGGWTLKSAIVDEHDAADAPFVVSPGQNVTGALVTFTDRPTEISGTLFDAARRGTPEYSIIAFATDRAAWTEASRRIRAARPNSDGVFQIAGLPPGEYYLVAVSDYDPRDLYDSSFLDQLTAAGFKITLADGEHKKQDLKVAGG